MKRVSLVLLLGVVLFLSGCAGEIVSDLYVEDVFEVAEFNEELFTPATVAIESMGTEFMEDVAELLKMAFRDATNFREQNRDYSTYVLADVKLPIVNVTYTDELPDEDLFSLVVFTEHEEGVLFGLGVNRELFDEIADYVYEEFWQALSFSGLTLTIRLNNDSKETVDLTLQNVYVNQVPVLYSDEYQLARRDSLELRLSDIMRDYAYNEGYVFVGAVR